MAVLPWRHPAPGQLKKGILMSDVNINAELQKAPVEPLLPIEKKLIGWSLGIGVVSLVILVVINRVIG